MSKTVYYIREFWQLTRDSVVSWYERDPFRNSTVISYYTIFSLPGLAVIIVNLAGYFFGTEAITDQISQEISAAIGEDAAESVEQIVANVYTGEGLTLSSIISLLTLLFGATGVFYQVQQTLNIIWNIEPQPDQMILKFLKDRLFSLGMILMIGFLLLVSLIISQLITMLSSWLDEIMSIFAVLIQILELILSLGIITLLFAAIFKILPDVKIRWKDVWPGAFFSALLFVAARFALNLYFSYSDPASIYGAAGSVILILLWTTYNGLILLYGAEFTRVYAKRYGIRIEPSDISVRRRENDKESDKPVSSEQKDR